MVRRREEEMTIQDFILKAEAAAAEMFDEKNAGRISIEKVEVVKTNDTRLHGLRLAHEGEPEAGF